MPSNRFVPVGDDHQPDVWILMRRSTNGDHLDHADAVASALQEALEEVERQRASDPGQLKLPGLELVTDGFLSDVSERRYEALELHPRAGLFHRLIRDGPGDSRDPPSYRWLVWILIDFTVTAMSCLRRVFNPGGEAKGWARARRFIVQFTVTAMLVVGGCAVFYWMTRTMFDPAPALAVLRDRAWDAAQWSVQTWLSWPFAVRATLTALPTAAAAAWGLIHHHRSKSTRTHVRNVAPVSVSTTWTT